MKYTRHEKGIQLLGLRLREIRKEKNLTQKQLADHSDLQLSQISRIERGLINTSISQIFQIAKALEVDVKTLFDFPEEY